MEFGVVELEFLNGRAFGTEVDAVVNGGGHGPHAAFQDAGELLVNVVGGGIEFSEVGAVNDVDVGIFSGADGEVPDLAGGIFLGQQKGSAGTEVGVVAIFGDLVIHLEIVGDGESAFGGEAKEGVAVIAFGGESGRGERGVEGAVAVEENDVAAGIGGHAGGGAPEAALAAIGREVENCGLFQRGGVVAHEPSGVGTDVTVRGPGKIDDVVDQEQAGAFDVLAGIEQDVAAGTVIAGAGILGGNFGGTFEEFGAGGGVEGVQALVIVAGGVFGHGDDVDDGVAGFGANDDGSRGDANLGRDRHAVVAVGGGFAGAEGGDVPDLEPVSAS